MISNKKNQFPSAIKTPVFQLPASSFQLPAFFSGLRASGFGLVLLFLSGCYVPKEGCLDISAANYDVTADDNCCCEYPELKFSVSHYADTVRLHPDSVYLDVAGHPFRIKNFSFYISDIQLFRGDGSFAEISDTVKVYTQGGLDSTDVTDDFTLIDLQGFSFPSGDFRESGDFTEIRFTVGLTGTVLESHPLFFEEGHPLGVQDNDMWDTLAGYYSIKAGIQRDTSTPDNISQILCDAANQSDTLEFNHLIYANEGYNTIIKLRINYLQWLAGINVQDDSNFEIAQKIVSNTTNAFTLE